LPTFIIAECVLIYLDPTPTGAIVSWASEKFSTAVFFLYEHVKSFHHALFCCLYVAFGIADYVLMQIHPDDAFGEQMIRNLEVPAYTHVFAQIIMNFVLHITRTILT
jgi:tRNA wybutosine-synthesizing protein 4